MGEKLMIPVNEGDEKCRKCRKFDMCHGCIDTYGENWRDKIPSCGRNIIISQKELKEIVDKEKNKDGKRKIFKNLQRNRS